MYVVEVFKWHLSTISMPGFSHLFILGYNHLLALCDDLLMIVMIQLTLFTHTHTRTQADVNGLKWIRYLGPNSSSLEAPKDDPVLNSYARLLSEG